MKLFPRVEALDLPRTTEGAFVALYYDDPEVTSEDALRSLAAITVSDDAVIGDLTDARIPSGKYVRAQVHGPYSELPEAWRRLRQELDKAGHTRREGATFEVYFTQAEDAPPEQIRTDLYFPIA